MIANKKPATGAASNITSENYIIMQEILSILESSLEPVSREYLSSQTGISDRAVRDIIRLARSEGYPICSNSGTKGYWLGGREDIRRLIAECKARARAELIVAEKLETNLIARTTVIDGQLCFEGMKVW